MAVTVNTYKLFPFVLEQAKEGVLCVMVYKDVTGSITDADETGEIKHFIGTGIIRSQSPNKNTMIIESKTYTFNWDGTCLTSGFEDYKLMLGEISIVLSDSGNTSGTMRGTTRSVASDTGEIIETPTTFEEVQPVNVTALNARDNFAVQALRSMLAKVDDPSTLSNNEMNFYCKQAYQWAANMMTEAGLVRIKLDDETPDVTEQVEVQSLEGNTEKLLNNIVAALEKTDKEIDEGNKKVNAERITIPELNKFLEEYVNHTETPEQGDPVTTKYGLFDLVKAIKDINVNVSTDDLVAAIQNQGKDADHPIYISGGGFPSRDVLAAAFTETIIHDFLTFNAAGAVGYSTKNEVKKAILGYLNSYSTLSALSTAVLGELTANAIYNKIQSKVDDRIKAWLQAARVTVDGTTYSLTVNTPT